MKRILYLGLKPPSGSFNEEIIHYPVISTEPKDYHSSNILFYLNNFLKYSHLIITSKNAFKYLIDFFKYNAFNLKGLKEIKIISVGGKTTSYIEENNFSIYKQAKSEQAEGIIDILEVLDLNQKKVFWPHSQKARPLIADYCKEKKIDLDEVAIYDTLHVQPNIKISLIDFNEIFFTSPSTVDAFFTIFNKIPNHLILKTIGPITENYLKNKMKNNI